MTRWLAGVLVGLLGNYAASVASAQVVFAPAGEVTPQLQYDRDFDPRAMSLLRSLSEPARAAFIPRWQFQGMSRPYKNAGVWATPKGTFTYTVPDAWEGQAAPNYYEMVDELELDATPVPPGEPKAPAPAKTEQQGQPGAKPKPQVQETNLVIAPSYPTYPAQGKIVIKPMHSGAKSATRLAGAR